MSTVQTQLQLEDKYPLPRGFSPSHIIGYIACPRSFFIRYVLKVKPDFISPVLELGSRVHEKLSNLIFESDNPEEQRYLSVAYDAFQRLPANPILETTYQDKTNPGRYTGQCLHYPFAATFDIHWLQPALGVDWKTGKYNERKNWQYEIQAYILNELYRQKNGYGINDFRFIFLDNGYVYHAQSLFLGELRTGIEEQIRSALDAIHARRFDKKVSYACSWCDVREYCRLDCGFR